MPAENVVALTETLKVTPLEPTVGAEISGVDLSKPLSPLQRDEIHTLLLRHKVIFFREQHISSEQQIAFAAQFGELYEHPTTQKQDSNKPQAHLILASQAKEAYGDARKGRWHTDTSWMLKPTYGAVLRAVSLPELGGDTVWADAGLVYRGLSDELKARIDNLYITHNFKSSLDRVGYHYPILAHPLVRTHPETGEDALFINFSMSPQVIGWSVEESRALVAELLKEFSNPEYQVRFKWTPGTIAFWDNRALLHYPVYNYGDFDRVMERVLIADDDIPHRVRKQAAV
ncbi:MULTISPECIES: TauD/TfdA dioxygenase family protein [Phytopseudomonas]|uniref:Taurine catabolism dioxygenase TauD n=1 Tax=Phytopseudomonas dryadis TaxID=2487520 RepID=A0A4Q9QT77_9GAMM|nr:MULTISPECIES: TauD/TfdA family dioxygenase [Pseudomonas]TBU73520.1 taurine catabolism dioxygenase TauD [Pseudomonas daroniae]TBU85646.1 taurine catabolism dioxygenase TauD [Pseudomonas dryadis]